MTTVDRVAEALRVEILGGGIAPGTPLREVEVAATTGVSRGSVRQAFSVLVNEGLLSQNSYRSVIVTTLDEHDIREIYQARRMIELSAVEATAGADEEHIAVLRKAYEEFVAAVEGADRNGIHLADVQVHAALVAVLGSGRLSRVHAGLMSELRLAATAQYKSPPEGATLVKRHGDFIDLVTAGKTDEARTQLADRLDNSEELLITAFREARARQG
ncbi:GntR family transcriptional regulator [Amycolatopsis sp. GM8]|uniref:GntR family transcriptional regulator n=1 Tax=Amycolatopsis sp. GM8 TaxID=2896530 RepID=UPI001F1FB42D|nr:GntR family transcriptional regulator [Amycolatopsis sp. GM8]